MMYQAIRRRVTYVNVAMTLALLFAMTGGAYAAKKYIITSTKQIKPSVLKQIESAGKPGPAGPAGPEGKAGPAGPGGKEGPLGPQGKEGPLGPQGKEGPLGPQGKEGPLGKEGLLGKEGPEGPLGPKGATGSPWTPNNTLPSGATEKGTWAALGMPGSTPLGVEAMFASISFTIPLAAAPEEANVIGFEEGEGESKEATAIKEGKCKGTVANPQAGAGNLCVFVQHLENVGITGENGVFPTNPETGSFPAAGTTGSAILVIAEKEKERVFARGTWAVTAK